MTKPVRFLLSICSILLPQCAFCQQDYVGRFDLYNGFAWLDSPSAKLQQRGYHLQAGVNARSWLAIGFDYSVSQGDFTLTPDLLKPALQTQIAGQLAALEAAGVIPAGYQVAVSTAAHYTDICLRAAARVPAFPTSDPICEAVDWRYLRSRDSASWRCDYDGDREAARAFREEDRLAGVLRFRRRSGL